MTLPYYQFVRLAIHIMGAWAEHYLYNTTQLRPLPHPAPRVQPAAQRRSRDLDTALELELRGQRRAAPPRAAQSHHEERPENQSHRAVQ